MRKIFKKIGCAVCALILFASCSDLLELESKTSVTNSYLYTTKDGLKKAVIGLYAYERDKVAGDKDTDNPCIYVLEMLDFDTDLILFRAGTGADIARLNTLTAASDQVSAYWKVMYGIIGKANEIVASAETLGLDDAEVARCAAEAKLFRARAYFNLYKHFERLYINTEPTTVDNLQRVFTPADKKDVFALIDSDLEFAIDHLDWALPQSNGTAMYGRFTKAVAKHVRAQVAMWEKDYDKAIEECESIFDEGKSYHKLLPHEHDAFNSADMRNKEVLYSYQFSANRGGGNTVSNTGKMTGHFLSIHTTAQYRSMTGGECDPNQGGYGFGRMFPNSYLLGLYDQAKDNRYSEMFVHYYKYFNPESPKYGTIIAREDAGENYLRYLHPMCVKHADYWTNQDLPTRQSSFKDLVVYRLAETYLMCAEAYFHKGNNAKALEYYNYTYTRAGNDEKTGTLSLDDLLDEYARELNFEGVRWSLLKRLGILGERCRLHEGDTRAEDPLLDSDYAFARANFVIGKHETWPIPSDQILLMGSDNFPQNNNWN